METKQNLQVPYLKIISISLIALMLTFAGAKWIGVFQSFQKQNQEKEKLTISAEGRLEATPDIAIVSLGVLTEGKNPVSIKEENSTKINAIIAELEKRGVDKKDIKTLQLDLQPKYNWDNGKSTLAGYILRQQIEVKIRDISKAGEIFSEATNLGSNEAGNIRYDFTDLEGLKQKARIIALENAKAKAEDLAKTAGIRLGKLINFTESNVFVPSYYRYGMGMEAVQSFTSTAPDIQPGTQEITANISVTYEIK